MKISGLDSKSFGGQLKGIITYLSPDLDLSQASGKFYSLRPSVQANRFTNPVWDIVRNIAHHVKKDHPVQQIEPDRSSPIIIGPKEGMDGTISLDASFNITDISLEQGGLATNTALTLRNFDQHSHLLTFIGSGERGDLHEHILETSHGLDISKAIRTLADSALHVCIKSANGGEYWFAPDSQRGCYNHNEITEYREVVENAIENSSKDPVVLTSVPSIASGDSFFAKVIGKAREHECPTFLNMKQFDPNEGYLKHLYDGGYVDFIKPNLREFAQLVRYSESNLIENTDSAEASLEQYLRKSIKDKDFKYIEELAKTILLMVPDTTLFISFGEDGAMAVNLKYTLICSAPKIKKECTTGAGDSGLGAMLVEAKRNSLNLLKLSDPELEILLKAFIAEASATCSLAGSKLGGPELYEQLKDQVKRVK